jgi:membrane protein implicated in regulation of membrane protease activity
VRLSKGRVLLRVALLAGAGAFMAWRAVERFRAGAALGADGLMLRRLALFEALLAALAFALAAFVLLAMRRRGTRRPLGLGRPPQPPGGRTARGAPPPSGADPDQ